MGRISIDKSLIKDLTELLEENNLSEITIQQGRQSVKVARNITSGATIVSQPNVTQKNSKIEKEIREQSKLENAIKAPMLGTLYHAPSPKAKAFIKVGKKVKTGDTLFIIEAMKTMNPVKSPYAGKVKEIIVSNEMSVEFDEALVIIDIS